CGRILLRSGRGLSGAAQHYRADPHHRPLGRMVAAAAERGEERMKPNLPVWRSMLFVPVTSQRFVDGAAKRGADAIILDLEDAVAASEKDRARTLVPEAAKLVSRGGADVVVRINRPLRMTVRDLEAVISPA